MKELTITKYGRYWALHRGAELICVTVYKKGAERVKMLLEEMTV